MASVAQSITNLAVYSKEMTVLLFNSGSVKSREAGPLPSARERWTCEAMALPFQKELEKYKNIDEDELLGKLSEEELKQLENVLDDLDPEVGGMELEWGA